MCSWATANPRWEITGTTGFDLLNRKLRIEGLFDAKTGFYQLDGTERIRCQSRLNCRARVRPHRSAVAAGGGGGRCERERDDDAIRVPRAGGTSSGCGRRRLLTKLPAAVARAVRADRLSFTLAGRNLWRDDGSSPGSIRGQLLRRRNGDCQQTSRRSRRHVLDVPPERVVLEEDTDS